MTEVAEVLVVHLPSPMPPLTMTPPTPMMPLPLSANAAAVVSAVVELGTVAAVCDSTDEATVLSAEENIHTVGYGYFDRGGIVAMSQRHVQQSRE